MGLKFSNLFGSFPGFGHSVIKAMFIDGGRRFDWKTFINMSGGVNSLSLNFLSRSIGRPSGSCSFSRCHVVNGAFSISSLVIF